MYVQRLTGKTAIITGASEGIGLAIAKRFAEQGAELILIARNKNRLEEVRRQLIMLTSANVHLITTDLSNFEYVKKCIDQIQSLTSNIDILVNNAGTAIFKNLERISVYDYEAIMNVNLRTPLFFTQAFEANLAKRKGCVLNISSHLADQMLPDKSSSVYSASKGALNSLTKALARELGPKGVRVNALSPGMIVGKTFEKISTCDAEITEQYEEDMPKFQPMGCFGKPEDVAAMALQLVSSESSWITGTVIPIDGGLSIS